MTNFNFELAIETANTIKAKSSVSSKFDTAIVLELIGRLKAATPAQITAAYNAGMQTDLKTKVFSDWLWGQAKRGVLVKLEDHKYALAQSVETVEPVETVPAV